ncbi:regulation of nuclear pre-mRNA domain-containing protein 1A-like [Clytia hemisphaerica]|uniref:CID domain-containing protein n=1 Tax=Clytia hemisphaerica TaxID=252671 RepID=A0A7M5XJ18_9CNID
MATFAESLETKLKSLEPSQTGIQTLSLWIIHHRHHSGIITNAWVDRVKKAKVEKRISLFYLANDVIQNGRKKAKDLVTAFGKAFLDVIHLYRESKNKSQVERVLSIWVERNVYEAGYVNKLKELLNNGVAPQPTSPVKTSPLKVQQKRSSVSSNSNVVQSSTKKGVPPNFKVSTLLMSIKKSVSLDSDAERKSKKLEGMRIDATSVDSIKNVKDRSSVGHFHKEFDDSKIMLEDYINTLRHNVQEKQKILPLLNSSEAFYALAQDEAKVIVNAYKTFGNRLNSMKRKLDVKISKLEDDASRTPEEQTDSRGHKMRSSSGGSIQDMDLDSESEEEDVPSSQAYNPSTAPSHEDLAQQGSTPSFLPTNGGMTSFLDSSASAQLLLQQQPMMMSTDIAAIATQQQAVQPDVFQQQQQQRFRRSTKHSS